MIEDGIVETSGAIGFAIASLIAFGLLVLPAAPRTFANRLLFAGMGAFALLLFLSEISFGARLFGFQMPRMEGGGEFDGGHDVVVVLYRMIEDAGRTGWILAAAGFGTILAATTVAVYVFWRRFLALLRLVLSNAFEFRLAVTLGMLIAAVLLDLSESRKIAILEEVLEFGASVAFVAAAFALLRRSTKGMAPWPTPWRGA